MRQALGYQREIITDPSRYVVITKSRRVGGSWAIALRSALRFLGVELQPDGSMRLVDPAPQVLVSASEPQSLDLLAAVRDHVEALGGALTMLDESRQLDVASCTKSELVTKGGTRARAFALSPRSIRGVEGDVTADEWAIWPRFDALWRAVAPVAGATVRNPHGYRITACGTPWIAGSPQHRMADGDGSESDTYRRWSRHTITAELAVLDHGFPFGAESTDEQRRAFLEELREGVDDLAWRSEYGCEWITGGDAYLPHALLTESVYLAGERPKSGTWFAGADLGKRDAFALVSGMRDEDGVTWFLPPVVLRGASFEAQTDTIAEALRSGAVSRVAVDAVGVGQAPTEALQRAFRGQVDGVTMTGDEKVELIGSFRLALERGLVRLPPDRDLLSDLSRIERTATNAGNIVLRSPRDSSGHGDRGAALLLAWRALRHAPRSGSGIWTERDFVPGWQPGPSAQLRALNAGIERKNYDDPAAYYRALRNPPRGISRRLRRFV